MSWHHRADGAQGLPSSARRAPRERFGAARSAREGARASHTTRGGCDRAVVALDLAPPRRSRRSLARDSSRKLFKSTHLRSVASSNPRGRSRRTRAPPRAPPRAWPPLPFLRSLVSATIRRGTTVVARADAYAGQDGAFPADADTVFASGPPSSVLSLASESESASHRPIIGVFFLADWEYSGFSDGLKTRRKRDNSFSRRSRGLPRRIRMRRQSRKTRGSRNEPPSRNTNRPAAYRRSSSVGKRTEQKRAHLRADGGPGEAAA